MGDVQTLPRKQGSAHVVVLEGRYYTASEACPSLLPPLPLCLSWWYGMVWNVPLANLSQLAWLCPLPRSCSLPAPGCGGMSVGRHCSAAAKALVSYRHSAIPQCKAQHWEAAKGK